MDLATAFYDVLAGDATLVALISTYHGEPAVFTQDPAPGDADLPYIVTAGEVANTAFDTKTRNGRRVWRDVRCYAATNGLDTVETMAERVRELLHRQKIAITDFETVVVECAGPIALDEPDAYGRIVTARIIAMEDET